MHKIYIQENTDYWFDFYKGTISTNPQYQFGGDLHGFRAFAPYHQRGAGLGSFFKSLFRMALPLLKTVGSQALISGSKIAADVGQGKNLKQSAIEHGKEGASILLHDVANRIHSGKGIGVRKRKLYKIKNLNKRSSLPKKRLKSIVGSDIFS